MAVNPVQQAREGGGGGVLVQSCSLFCGEPKTEPGTGPRPGRLREATAHTRICVCAPVRGHVCRSPGMLTHQLAENRGEHEAPGERSDPAAAAAAGFLRGDVKR